MSEQNLYSSPDSEIEQNNSSDTLDLAGRWTRLGAKLLDVIFMLITFIPGIFNFFNIQDSYEKTYSGIIISVIAFIALIIIQTIYLSIHGQTLGKKVLNIKIVRDEDNSNPGFVKAVILRVWVISLLSNIPFIGAFVGLVDALMIFRSDRKCLHDLIANTKVVDC